MLHGMPSPEAPLTGGCACGAVRIAVTAPFAAAGHCHCHRCQKRSGSLWATGAGVQTSAFAITDGAGLVRLWEPPEGLAKAFCTHCGGHVFGGDPAKDPYVVVRFGALDGDPGIAPQWRQWVASAPAWAPVPDDGLPRFEGARA